MGAWGDQPNENDGSRDLFDDVCRKTASIVEKKFFSVKPRDAHDQWERAGMIQLVIDTMPGCVDFLQDTLKTVRDDLDDILGDEEFISAWKSPANVRKNAKAFQKKIENLLLKM